MAYRLNGRVLDMNENLAYTVMNCRTSVVIGTYKSSTRARAVANRADLAYGASIHVVRIVRGTV